MKKGVARATPLPFGDAERGAARSRFAQRSPARRTWCYLTCSTSVSVPLCSLPAHAPGPPGPGGRALDHASHIASGLTRFGYRPATTAARSAAPRPAAATEHAVWCGLCMPHRCPSDPTRRAPGCPDTAAAHAERAGRAGCHIPRTFVGAPACRRRRGRSKSRSATGHTRSKDGVAKLPVYS